MDKLLLALGIIFVVLLLVPIFSGICAWTVGLLFGDTIIAFLSQLGITGFSMFELGVCLGFLGSFFKSVPVSK